MADLGDTLSDAIRVRPGNVASSLAQAGGPSFIHHENRALKHLLQVAQL